MDPSRELHQEMGITSNSLENIMVCSKAQQQEQQRKPRPQQEQALKCPRCDSTNTKFCYYNNYSLSQPRYFCKSCRRYWTKGGTLRNVPVGGGCRKNKRSSSSSSSKRSTSQDHHQPLMITSNNNPLSNLQYPSLSSYDCNDLSLAFARLQKQQQQQQQTCGFDQDEHDDDDGSNNHHQNLSILGNSISHLSNNNAHFENFLGNPNSSSVSNFHETPFHNFYYGGLENGNGGNGGEMMIPYHHHHQEEATTAAVVVSTMKQESEMNNNGRVLWGFPWQIGGSAEQENMMVGGGGGGEHNQLDSGREIWNNGLAPSWHGLLNSPLM